MDMRNDGMSHVVDDVELACLRASPCVLGRCRFRGRMV
jgi:hypothetical protein